MAATVVTEFSINLKAETKSAQQSLKSFEGMFKGFASAIGAASAKIGKKLISPFTEMGERVSTFATKLKNIIAYRILRQGISKMIQGLEEGKKNIVAYDTALNGTSWSKATALMNGMATNALYLKNTFGSLYMTLLGMVKPAIDAITDALVAAVNAVNMFISALSGKGGFTKALKYPAEYAENANAAAAATKRWLGAFDEINRIDAPGGGGSSNKEDFSKMFEESGFTGPFADVAASIKDAIENGSWGEAGKTLAAKLNELITGANLYEAGAQLGTKIQNAVDFAIGFLRELKADNAGSKLAEWFNGLVDYVEWEDLGTLFSLGIGKALDFFAGLVKDIKWEKVATAISDWLHGAITEATSWLQSKDWKSATEFAYNTIKGFLLNIEFGTIFGDLWALATTSIKVGIGALLSGLAMVFNDIAAKFREAGIDWAADLFEGIVPGLETVFETVEKWVKKIGDVLNIDGLEFLTTLAHGGVTGALTKLSGRAAGKLAGGAATLLENVITRADGGSVPNGQLFIANEAGPELIGQVGGRTQVTNQAQFVQGLEAANVNVVSAIAQMTAAIVSAVNNKDFNVELDGMKVSRSISRNLNTLNRYNGTSLVQGV